MESDTDISNMVRCNYKLALRRDQKTTTVTQILSASNSRGDSISFPISYIKSNY